MGFAALTDQSYEDMATEMENLDPTKRSLSLEKYLSGGQMKALNMYALGMSWQKIAKELGVSDSQITYWRRLPPFRKAIIEISEEAVIQAKLNMKAAMPKIVDKMIELADEGNIMAIKDTLDRVFGDAKQQNPQQQNQNIAIQVNLAAHRDSEI